MSKQDREKLWSDGLKIKRGINAFLIQENPSIDMQRNESWDVNKDGGKLSITRIGIKVINV